MKLFEREGRMQRNDDFGRQSVVDVIAGETGETKPYEMVAKRQWFLEAKVSVTFWANKAQYNDARKIAERALKARLYEGVLMEIHNARLAVSNGDKREAWSALDRMQKIVDD